MSINFRVDSCRRFRSGCLFARDNAPPIPVRSSMLKLSRAVGQGLLTHTREGHATLARVRSICGETYSECLRSHGGIDTAWNGIQHCVLRYESFPGRA